jgi:hypothetical protein
MIRDNKGTDSSAKAFHVIIQRMAKGTQPQGIVLRKRVKNSKDSVVTYTDTSSKPLKKTKHIIAQEKITILILNRARTL